MIGKDLTEGSVARTIIGYSLPYLFAYFLQLLYGLADLFIVGQFYEDSVSTITAVALGSQVMHFVTVIVVGLAMGTTVSIAQAVGAHNDWKAANVIGNTITIFLILSLLLSAVLYIGVSEIVNIIATPMESFTETSQYLRICFLGIPAIVGYNVMAGIYRGLGDTRTPMYFVAVACGINILADYILIGGLHMGAMGAALATVLAQSVAVIISILHMTYSRIDIRLTREHMHPNRATMKRIFQIGLPVALQDGFIQVAFLVITIIANNRGLVDAAAVGIVEKVICFLFLIPSTMLSTVSALAAQNLGAEKPERARAVLRYAICIATVFGVVVSVAMQFLDTDVMRLFTSDERVITQGAAYFDGYVWDTVFAGIHFCFSGYFCACNLSFLSFVHNMASITIFRVPLAYWSSITYPETLFPMGIATVSGSVVSVLLCLYFYYFFIPKKKIRSYR